MISKELAVIILTVIIGYVLYQIFNRLIFPKIINKCTKSIEINPKWITEKTKEYYGFSDIEFVIVESPFGMTPRFRATKDRKHLQMLLDTDITTREIDELLRLALAAKIRINYGVWYPDKPIHWLSILCYMLDGGDVKIGEAKLEQKVENK